ncbi:hypothetical protein [Saliphagus infecundisoli]|uniref:DNA primase/helicase n=1 Tax=Saliphagus infecundisoli TaxID=1849069 RepID=A0ABD5QAL4_9EURY|nr:hypothetical protein [Saliphagus infecundisoli]
MNKSVSQKQSRFDPTKFGLNQWVSWRYEQNKEKKAPINPDTGGYASTNKPDTWGTYQKATKRVESDNLDGIGFVLTEDDPYSLIDLDGCRDPQTGELDEYAEKIIEKLDCYVEISPSGTGLHIYVRGEKPAGYSNTDSVEIYESDFYTTITGNHLNGTPQGIESRQNELDEICEEYLTEKGGSDTSSDRDYGSYTDPENANVDEDGANIVYADIEDFRNRQRTTQRAYQYINDLIEGRNYKKWGFQTGEGDEDRSNANLSLAGKLNGILLMAGEDDPERRKDLIENFLIHVARKYRKTREADDSGYEYEKSPRKLLLEGDYLSNTVSEAIETFEWEIFEKWSWKKEYVDRSSNDYGDGRYQAVYETTETLAQNRIGKYGYPTREEIAKFTQLEEENPLEIGSYENTVSRHPRLKKAKLGHNRYVFYPKTEPDPEEAEWVKFPDHSTKYEPGTLDSWTGPEVVEK